MWLLFFSGSADSSTYSVVLLLLLDCVDCAGCRGCGQGAAEGTKHWLCRESVCVHYTTAEHVCILLCVHHHCLGLGFTGRPARTTCVSCRRHMVHTLWAGPWVCGIWVGMHIVGNIPESCIVLEARLARCATGCWSIVHQSI